MGKNKAKTAISVAVVVKPEVEIWRRPKNELFDPGIVAALMQDDDLSRS